MRITRALAAAGLAAALLIGAAHTPRAAAGELPGGTRFFNSPDSLVNKWVAAHPGDSRQPRIASRIASRPQALWFSRYSPATVTEDVRKVTSAASTSGQTPVLVTYQVPNRDCGGASAGGAPDLASYDAWVRGFAAGLGSGPVVVILEPDSIALISCLSSSELAAATPRWPAPPPPSTVRTPTRGCTSTPGTPPGTAPPSRRHGSARPGC
ncbi:glycoside hydrolase family 6 protein [Streptomyces hygroscopicus]|uniref:glycoside hydrolase family 6 protein n=1 Tax=Streptomyces hygroscopicus TaxID=1912 RepID=UPI0007675539